MASFPALRSPDMSPDEPDSNRTQIQPPGSGSGAAGFDKTQVHAPTPARPPLAATVLVPPPPAPDMGNSLAIGTRLAEFELIKLLGDGGLGIVYLATDHSLQRRVALQEYMPSSLAARSGNMQVQVKSERYRETFEVWRKSFINEARLLAQFDHPSLVALPPTAVFVPQRRASLPPSVAPMQSTTAAPVAAKGNGNGNGAVIGVGLGVLVLGALAFGGWRMLAAPASSPAVAAAPVPVPSPVPTPASPAVPAAPTRFELERGFDRTVQAQTAGFGVNAAPVKAELRISKADEFKFRVVSTHKRNFDALQPKPEGPIKHFPSGDQATALAAQFSGPDSTLAGRPECAAGTDCADEYGAALMKIETLC